MNPLIISDEDFKNLKDYDEVETIQIEFYGDNYFAAGNIISVSNKSMTEVIRTKIKSRIEVPSIPEDANKAYKCYLEKY